MMPYMHGFFSFRIAFAVFSAAFLIVFGIIIFKLLKQYAYNSNAPEVTCAARVSDKQSRLVHRQNGSHHYSSRRYYLTFELCSDALEKENELLEFSVHRDEYELAAVGDKVRITYKGTRILKLEHI